MAVRLGIKVKNLTAETLYNLVKEKKIEYESIRALDPKKFSDLEYTMKLIFNHDEEKIEILEEVEPEEEQGSSTVPGHM